MLDKLREFSKFLLPLGAAAALLETLVLAWNERVSAATLTAGVFVVLVLFHYFPQLESFKAFTIEAKLRERLSEAETILNNLRRLALVAAKQNFLQLAQQNRLGGISNQRKRDLTIEFSELLSILGVEDRHIEDARSPLVAFAGLDLLASLYTIARMRFETITQALHNEQQAIFGSEAIQMSGPRWDKYQEIGEGIRSLQLSANYVDILKDPTVETFRALVRQMTDMQAAPESDTKKLAALGDEITSLFKAMLTAGIITPAVADYLEGRGSYESRAQLYEELFPGSRPPY